MNNIKSRANENITWLDPEPINLSSSKEFIYFFLNMHLVLNLYC